MTAGWLVSPSEDPTAHIVRPGLGLTEDTLLPLLQLDREVSCTASGMDAHDPLSITLNT
jgi:hypothetical protein